MLLSVRSARLVRQEMILNLILVAMMERQYLLQLQVAMALMVLADWICGTIMERVVKLQI